MTVEGKTIQQLVDEFGLGIKVTHEGWRSEEWFDVIGPMRSESFPGYDEIGKAIALSGIDSVWKLWTPPPEKKDRWVIGVEKKTGTIVRQYQALYLMRESDLDSTVDRLPHLDPPENWSPSDG